MTESKDSLEDKQERHGPESSGKKTGSCCHQGIRPWCKQYFWEGQLHEEDIKPDEGDLSGPLGQIGRPMRKALAFLIPAVIFHATWLAVMIAKDLWFVFPQKYYMSLTMIVGSMVAGMTSTGGGAVAFPVMTLAFNVDPMIARDFSVMIQSCGMSAASFSILFMKVLVEYHSLLWCSLGGTAGVIFGLEVIDPLLSPAQKKMIFVSVWISFTFALFLLNLRRGRQTFATLQKVTWWKTAILTLVGGIGGIFTSIAGSGIDIATFSVLTTLFRLSEKVATPTSVILMAVNSLVCFFWRGLIMHGISESSWHFLLACIPVVTIGAPIGSLLGTHFHRLVLASFLYVLNTVALISAFVIVPQTPVLIGSSVGMIVGGLLVFLVLTKLGEKLMKSDSIKDDSKSCNSKNIKTVIVCLKGQCKEIKPPNHGSKETQVAEINDRTSTTPL